MRLKISLDQSLFVVCILNIIFSSIIIFLPNSNFFGEATYTKLAPLVVTQHSQNLVSATSTESVQSTTSPEQAGPSLPVRIKIPKINVDTILERVGLAADGAVGTPKNQNDAAWFDLGPRPGESGSAIITGHYGWKNRKASAFDNLYKLRKGDFVYVNDENGATTTFMVRESRRYDPNAAAIDVFGTDDDTPHLNLVSCEGDWNKDAKSYSARLVIFTDQVIE